MNCLSVRFSGWLSCHRRLRSLESRLHTLSHLLVFIPIKFAQKMACGSRPSGKEIYLILVTHIKVQPIVLASIYASHQPLVVRIARYEVIVQAVARGIEDCSG